MEADICEENVSLPAANIIDQKVSDNVNIDESVGNSAENQNVTKTVDDSDDKLQNIDDILSNKEGGDSHDKLKNNYCSLSNNKEDDSDDKPQNSDSSLLNKDEDGNYYEVISADGSVGGDDIDDADANDVIGSQDKQFNLTNAGLSSSVVNETCSFVELPFVPKFEFPLDPCQSENVSNSGAFCVNRFISDNIPKPDKNFTIPPPNFRPLDIKPSFDSLQGTIFSSPVHNSTFFLKDEIVSTVSEKPCEITSSSRDVGKESKNLPEPSKKNAVVDWVDENGDPLPGAFDYVKPNEERDVSVENTRVEYVYSVREKKEVPVDSNEPCVLNSAFLISQNVLHKNVAGNLGVHLRLPPGSSGIAKKGLNEDEEKKLYEASKSGAEYKAAVQAVTASTSTTDTSLNRIVPENETAKKDQPLRFKRRNRFTDIKKEDERDDEPSEVKPQKSVEEVALESQAVTEILKEVQRGAARAKELGALGWQKCPMPVTNKTFLRNTLVSTLREPYRPPSKRGRFHVGLTGNDDSGKQKKRDDDRSSSSRSSRSRSSSRGRSSSYSRSGSSYTDDDHPGSRDKHRQFSQRGRGSWNRGQHHYYDETWAAYAAHYGYPWYGPEALPMFYGPEGWPMDPYGAMYYGDPQAWMEYEAYYGPQNFGPRGMGRGFRGRGRGGRGRGGYEGDFRGYNIGGRSPREYSRSRSRSGRSRSWSRDLSRSRSRSRGGSFEKRDGSHSASQDRADRKSKRRPRSKGDSGEKTASDAETSEKKKKKKKKKHKHKKLKKSKHRHKGENSKSGDKNAEESVGEVTETITISGMDVEKEKPGKKGVENDDIVKKINVAKSEKRKEQTKYKSGDKDEKNDQKKIKERKFDNKTRDDVSEKGIKIKSKGGNRTVDEQLGSAKNNEQAFDVRDEQKQGTRNQKDKLTQYSDGESKYKGSSSKGSMDKSKSEDLSIKLKEKTGDSHEKQVQRKGDQTNDNRVNVIRAQMYVESDNRINSQGKQGIDRQREGGSSAFKEESRISGERYKYHEDKDGFMFDKRGGLENKDKRDTSGAKVDRRGESRERKEGDVYRRGRDDSRGRLSHDSIQFKQGRGGTQGDRSESCDSGRSSDNDGRSSRDSHKYKLNKDVAGRNRRSESNENASKSRMMDGRRPRIGGYKDGRSMTHGDSIKRGGRSESCDDREGDPKDSYKQKMGRDNQGENRINHSYDGQERLRKVDCSYKQGTDDGLLVTKGSRKLDNLIIRQTSSKLGGNKYNEKDGSSDNTEREKKKSGDKEMNRLVSKQKVLPTDNREESCEKTAACFHKDTHRKSQRSTSCDKLEGSFDKIQTKRIISLAAGGNERQKAKHKDNENEGSKRYEDESVFEGQQSGRLVKSGNNRIQSNEKQTVNPKMKEISLKELRERTESKIQQGSEYCEKTSSPEKLKEKRVLKRIQVGKKSGSTIGKTGLELKNQDSIIDSNKHPDVTDRDGIPNRDKIEENTDIRPKDGSKGVKRKKKIMKKAGSKKIKASSVREPAGGEKLITEGVGETSKAAEKQLAPEFIINKESEKKSLDATVESSK